MKPVVEVEVSTSTLHPKLSVAHIFYTIQQMTHQPPNRLRGPCLFLQPSKATPSSPHNLFCFTSSPLSSLLHLSQPEKKK